MSRFQFPPPAPTSFPIAATTVTDNFHRADENPIGAPWDVSAWTGFEAQISSNLFVNSAATSWAGGAYYDPVTKHTNTECVAQLGSSLVGITNATIEIGFQDPGVQSFRAQIVDGFAAIYQDLQSAFIPITASVGDRIGIRLEGPTRCSGWYQQTGSLSWQYIGSLVGSNAYPKNAYAYTFSDDGLVAISEFRIAEVGQLIPQKPVSGSSRNSW